MAKRVATAAIVAGIAFVATWAVSAASADRYRATTRISLTMEVRWPFYDAVREQQQVRLEQPETFADVQSRLAERLGAQLFDLNLQVPKSQSFLDLDAVADTPEAAAFAADAAAANVLAADQQSELARQTAGGSATEAAAIVESYAPRLEVVRAAAVPVGADRNPVLDGYVAALLAGAAALTVATVLAARRGVAPTPLTAAQIAGIDAVGSFGVGQRSVHGFLVNARGLLAVRSVRPDADDGPFVEGIAESLRALGRRVVVVSDRPGLIGPDTAFDRIKALEPGEVGRVSLASVDSASFAHTDFPAWMTDLAGAADIVLVASSRSDRGDRLARCADTVLYVGDGDIRRSTWSDVGAELPGYGGQRLVAFSADIPALDLRAHAAPSDLRIEV